MKWRVYDDAKTDKYKGFWREQKAYEYYNAIREEVPGGDHYVEEPLHVTFLRDVIYVAKKKLRCIKRTFSRR
jgi:hypothetical protein